MSRFAGHCFALPCAALHWFALLRLVLPCLAWHCQELHDLACHCIDSALPCIALLRIDFQGISLLSIALRCFAFLFIALLRLTFHCVVLLGIDLRWACSA